MGSSYAVIWQEAGKPQSCGRLELDVDGVLLTGSDGAQMIDYADLVDVRNAPTSAERLSGRPTLVLDRRSGGSLRITSVVQPAVLSELADRLADCIRRLA